MPDQRAGDTLIRTYWTRSGWRAEGERNAEPTEFDYAKRCGVMFDDVPAEHADLLGT